MVEVEQVQVAGRKGIVGHTYMGTKEVVYEEMEKRKRRVRGARKRRQVVEKKNANKWQAGGGIYAPACRQGTWKNQEGRYIQEMGTYGWCVQVVEKAEK